MCISFHYNTKDLTDPPSRVCHKRGNVAAARLAGLSPNDAINSLAVLRFVERFWRAEVYQLPAKGPIGVEGGKAHQQLKGRYLFGPDVDDAYLEHQISKGARIKATPITEVYDHQLFLSHNGSTAKPLFLVTETDTLVPYATDRLPTPQPGQQLLSLIEVQERTPVANVVLSIIPSQSHYLQHPRMR